MDADKTKVVVEGEASESDDDAPKENIKTQTIPSEVTSATGSKQTSTASNVVVSGEASESDDEEDSTAASASTTPKPATATSEVIVSGEAPESEDEIDNSSALPSLNVQRTEAGDETSSPSTEPTSPFLPAMEHKPKFNSLLNRKLRERNIALRKHIVDTVHHSYTSAAKELHNIGLNIQKSHITAQDVSQNIRNVTNNLLRIEDTLNIFSTCEILPDITFPEQSVQ